MKVSAETKSSLWQGLFEQIDRELGPQQHDPKTLLHFITKFGCYTFPRAVTDPLNENIVADYLAWLDQNGTPLEGLPASIVESAFVHPSFVQTVRGRSVSTMLLFHICIAMRLAPHLPERPRILEIGGGYGGLARVAKLLWPGCTYTILDLTESLRFSTLFLEQNFPDARVRRLASEDDKADSGAAADIEMVPADAMETLHGRTFDVAINTCSFGEMSQASVDSYCDLIDRRIETRLMYSINRFGLRPFGDRPFQAPRSAGGNTANMAFFLGPDWDVRFWDCWNETGFAEIEIAAAPYLEVLLERVDSVHTTEARRKAKAAVLLEAAKTCGPGTGEWHYCLFNALRYYPTVTAAAIYVGYLATHRWPETDFFRRMSATAHPDSEGAAPQSIEDDIQALVPSRMPITWLNRTYARRTHERMRELEQNALQHEQTIRQLNESFRQLSEMAKRYAQKLDSTGPPATPPKST